jgi:23S rRNA pseudouridine1911/1915/1917 synthase
MTTKENIKNYNIEIIDETNDFLIVYKPAGLIVHGGPGVKDKALSDLLVSQYPEIIDVGEDSNRPGIVHRLDKEVGGLLIIARNNESFSFFKEKFKNRLIKKGYTTLVYKQIVADFDTINFPIARSKKTGKMVALPLSVSNIKNKLNNRDKGNIKSILSSKEAETKFNVSKRFVNYSLLNIETSTGRTHQIRVHLSAYGHPIVGDNIYGDKKSKLNNKKINLTRVFLEADKLSFTNLNKKKYSYKLNLPKNLENFLKKLN